MKINTAEKKMRGFPTIVLFIPQTHISIVSTMWLGKSFSFIFYNSLFICMSGIFIHFHNYNLPYYRTFIAKYFGW